MKTTVKLVSLLCALLMVFSLAACGEKADTAKDSDAKTTSSDSDSTPAPAANDKLTDFGWVKFEMPEGYSDSKESDSYVTIAEDADSHHIIKFFSQTLFSGKTAADVAAEKADDKNTLGEKITVNGRDWYPLYFKFNDKDSVKLYTDVNESKYVYLTVYEMTENEPAVQTVLNSIEIIPDAE